MLLRTKKSIISLLVMICAVLFATIVTAITQSVSKAYAYTTAQLEVATVIDVYNEDTKKFTEKGLNNLAINAGYSDLNAMISAATEEGTALSPKFTDTVVRLGVDRTDGGSDLKWVPVYLSHSTDGDAILTLWLATDIYKSSWSDGTFSMNGTKIFNGNTICSNTYDGSYIRHKLNGKTGWTTDWDTGGNPSAANDNIGTMVSDFYGSGELSSYVVTPSKVSWQTGTGSNRMKNDPDWAGNPTIAANYPCDWINDNVWLPSLYEVFDIDITANSTATTLTADGGLWGVNVGNVNSLNDSYNWLRSGHPLYRFSSCLLNGNDSGIYNQFSVNAANGVRPAIHINLKSAAAAAEPAHVHVWESWTTTTPATCVSKGIEERKCTAADCPLTDSKEMREIDIDLAAHDWDAAWVSDGTNHWHECTVCGEKDTLIAHTAGKWIVDTPAQIGVAGSKHKQCTVCGYEMESAEIPALTDPTHTHNLTHYAAVGATAEAAGNIEYWSCAECGKYFSDAGGLTEIADKSSVEIPKLITEDNVANGLSAGAVAGIVIACVIVVLVAAYVAGYFFLYRKGMLLKGKAFDAIYVPMNAIFNKIEE